MELWALRVDVLSRLFAEAFEISEKRVRPKSEAVFRVFTSRKASVLRRTAEREIARFNASKVCIATGVEPDSAAAVHAGVCHRKSRARNAAKARHRERLE